jgi:subtilisin family serine protease
MLWAQQTRYTYHDKLFGKTHTFTPKPDEVMVRFHPSSQVGAAAQGVRTRFGLVPVHEEGLERHRFGVYRVPVGATAEALRASLKADPAVAEAYPAMTNKDGGTSYFVPDLVTVRFHDHVSEAAMQAQIRQMGSTIVKDHWTAGYYTVSVPRGADVFDLVRAFIDLPDVKFAELAFYGFNDLAFTPNDTFYAQQWAMRNDGTTGGTLDADADVQEAWDIERGDANVVVAVVDTGVDWDHPDLQPNILQNLDEDDDGDGQTMVWDGANWVMDAGDLNGVDDDGNGLVDDLLGWDFDDDDNDPNDIDNDCAIGGSGCHGTACAGLVAAVGDNALGVSGAAPGVRVMPLRVNLTSGMNANRADAINYAVGEAAKYDALIVSGSWRMGSGDMTAVEDAVVNARASGVLPMFASGNGDDDQPDFPARYDDAMAVGATSPCDERKNPASCDGENFWGSNYGDELDVSAPGVLMYTTDIAGGDGYTGDDYNSGFNGTSSATPLAAGIAALVQSHALELTGAALDPDELQDILEVSADDVGGYDYNYDAGRPGYSFELGAGRINANRALQELIARTVVDLQPEPVDLALSIDVSGSMYAAKLDAAKNAARQIVRLMNLGDRIAVTSYSNTATTNLDMRDIVDESDKDDAINAIDALVAGGSTCIGCGLLEAYGELVTAFPPNYPQSIILMSDGISNTAPWVDDVLPFVPETIDAYTIGFGTSSTSIDEDTLQTIASTTGGAYFFAGADGFAGPSVDDGSAAPQAPLAATTGGLTLIQSYQAAFNKASQRQMLGLLSGLAEGKPATETVNVDASTDEMRFSLLWELTTSTTFDFTLKSPSGKLIDPKEADNNKNIDYLEDTSLAHYTVRDPEPGLWTMEVNAEKGGGDYVLSASGYTTLRAMLAMDDDDLCGPITLTLRLLDGGLPLPNATVDVTLRIPFGQTATLALKDDGAGPDEIKGDGVYTAEYDDLKDAGSYSAEAFVSGKTLKGELFSRYDVASTFVESKRECDDLVSVALPTLVAPTGSLVKLPIEVNEDVGGLGITSFETIYTFDTSVLKPTGKLILDNTLAEGWATSLTTSTSGEVTLKGNGADLDGKGVLAYVEFEVVGKDGTSTNLKFTDFSFNGGAVQDQTSDGSFAVGDMFLDEPFLMVTAPNGGENFTIGTVMNIAWDSDGLPGNVQIRLMDGTTQVRLISSGTPNDGSHSWTILSTTPPGSNYTIRVTPTDNVDLKDESDAPFTISAVPQITVTAPNGGEVFTVGTAMKINWTSQNITGNVQIRLMDGTRVVRLISNGTTNDGSHSWTILSTILPGSNYKIRVTSATNTTVKDESDAPFTINAASAKVGEQGLALSGSLALPEAFSLEAAYPNPFNPVTTLRYALPEAATVRLVVYDLLGREVARLVEGVQQAGYHAVAFDGARLASGVYLYRLEAGTFVQTRRMTLVK